MSKSKSIELTEKEKQGVRELDKAIQKAGAKIWDEHPNNPKNKAKAKK